MRKAFKTSRLIGLLALMAGFMAISVSSAQATAGATWLKNGAVITSNTPVQARAETHGTLLTNVGLSKVEILCPKIKFVNALLETNGKASGKIHFEECTTKLNGTAAAKCTPKSEGSKTAGLIETNQLEGLQVLHELGGGVKDQLLKLSPVAAGLVFVTLELGPECAIGNKFDIKGHFFLKDCQNESLVDKVEHLFEEGPLTELLFGANKATIHGSAFGFLAAPNLGASFAGHV